MTAIAALLCAACRREPPPAAPPPSATRDSSLLPLCLRVLDGDRAAGSAFAAHPIAAKMSAGMRPQVVYTPRELAAAAFAPAPDPRFSWDRFRQNAAHVRAFIDHVGPRQPELLARAIGCARELVDVPLAPADLPVHYVCGGPWDAYVLVFERSELFFDVGLVADGPLDDILPGFEGLLAHEVWHLAFLDHQKRRRWPVDHRESPDPAARFLYTSLNEGIGHYFSLRHRLHPTNQVEQFEDKEQRVYAMLAARYAPWRDEPDRAAQDAGLWSSHAGVPFWDKWGAVPVALLVDRLVESEGRDAVTRAIEREPFSLYVAYDDACARHPGWPRLPAALVDDARRLSTPRRGASQGPTWGHR